MKVCLKETVLAAVSRLRRRYVVEVPNLNGSDIQGCQNCLSYGLTRCS